MTTKSREDQRRGRRAELAEDADRLVDPVKAHEMADKPGAIKWEISPAGTDRVDQQQRGDPAEPGTQPGLRHEPGRGQARRPPGSRRHRPGLPGTCLRSVVPSGPRASIGSTADVAAGPGKPSPRARRGPTGPAQAAWTTPIQGRKEELGETSRSRATRSRAVVHPGRAAEIIGRTVDGGQSRVNAGGLRADSSDNALAASHLPISR